MNINVVETTEELQETLVKAKVYVGLATTLFSYMLYRTEIHFTNDASVSTAGATITDKGNFIFINVDFWLTLNDKQRAFLLLHEVNHIFLEHPIRVKENSYEPTLYNIAADYNINLMCTGAYLNNGRASYNERYKKYLEFIDGGLLDEKYIGMSSDEIYHLLLESSEKQPMSKFSDDIIEGEGGEDAIDVQVQVNRRTAIEAVINAQSAQSIGENEEEIVRAFENLVKPKVDWTEKLQNIFVKYGKERTTYKRYNRKSNQVIFPSYEGLGISVVFGIDTSGSMGIADITRAVSELKGLLESYDSWKLHLLTADTKAHLIGYFDSENDDFSTIDFSKMLGGGGTRMDVMVDYAREVNMKEEINSCIILTDGYLSPDDLQTVEDFGIITVVTENGNKSYNNSSVEVVHV